MFPRYLHSGLVYDSQINLSKHFFGNRVAERVCKESNHANFKMYELQRHKLREKLRRLTTAAPSEECNGIVAFSNISVPFIPNHPYCRLLFDELPLLLLSCHYSLAISSIIVKSMARTAAQKQALRDAAAQVVADRASVLQALILAADEIMGRNNGVKWKQGGVNHGDVYMAVIDKQSGTGFVQVTKEGHCGPQISVGPSQSGYETVKIEQDQYCIVFHSCAVLYIRRN
ncbi:hypothetical protein VTL71DRAFT_13704 [Oculimacula yallundae]|uniref:Uncharacterized protein n=1 Tax=Oculimacula yallundae TaxID=86028 RepID=A0ABR4CL80_9HELO